MGTTRRRPFRRDTTFEPSITPGRSSMPDGSPGAALGLINPAVRIGLRPAFPAQPGPDVNRLKVIR